MTMLVSISEMAELLGVSVKTFRRNYLPTIELANAKRNNKQKLFIDGGGTRLHRRFDADRVKEFLLTKR